MSLSAFEEIILDPHASESQKAAAHKMIDLTKAKEKAETEPVGNVKLPDAPVHTRDDKTTYRYHSLVVSQDYAQELQRKYGTLHDGRATSEAGQRLLDAAYSDESDIPEFLKKFPESEAFFKDAIACQKNFYDSLRSSQAGLGDACKVEKEKLPIEHQPVLVQPVQPVQPASQVSHDSFSAALNLKTLLGSR